MRVFVTGATGFIGSAIVRELLTSGHKVLALAHSDAAAKTLAYLGVEAHRGDLSDIAGLTAGARVCDGVIHTAFIQDFSAFAASVESDRRAVAALAGALEGSGKPFVMTSPTMVLAPGRTGTEEDAPGNKANPRAATEATALAAAGRGTRVSVVRLPQVHGRRGGLVPMLIEIARRTGISAYVGDGANRWPAVHRLDAARVYRLALEKADAGTRLHAVAEEGVPTRAIAQAIGTGLGLPVRSLTGDKARLHFGWMATFVATDNPTSSAITRISLGWRPREAELLTEMSDSGYFVDVNRLAGSGSAQVGRIQSGHS